MLMLQRVFRPGEEKQKEMFQLQVNLLTTCTAGWTPSYLKVLITSGTIPQDYIDSILDYLGKYPRLVTIEKWQFLGAAQVARPDLYTLLVTPEGDAWLEKAMLKLGRDLALKPLKWLMKGGK